WHAGRGAWPGWPTNNANYHVIGIEAVSRGDGSDWTPAQLDAYKRGCAAILRKIGRDSGSCVAHREYSSEGKIDPAGIDMPAFRRDVQALIDRTHAPNQKGSNVFGDEVIRNRRGRDINAGEMIAYIDEHTGLGLDQLAGPGARDGKGFPGWEFLGDRTVAEMLGALGEKLGIPGCRDPKASQK
ncbi:peptidoglycan recognition protein family protein, partial [Nocardia otitidiscaviarum]